MNVASTNYLILSINNSIICDNISMKDEIKNGSFLALGFRSRIINNV